MAPKKTSVKSVAVVVPEPAVVKPAVVKTAEVVKTKTAVVKTEPKPVPVVVVKPALTKAEKLNHPDYMPNPYSNGAPVLKTGNIGLKLQAGEVPEKQWTPMEAILWALELVQRHHGFTDEEMKTTLAAGADSFPRSFPARWGGKAKAGKKHPNHPEGPLNQAFRYAQDHRAETKAENPHLSHGEVSTLLGLKWKALPAEEKAPYVKLATEDRARYAAEMVEFEKEYPEEARTKSASSSPTVPGSTKRTAYVEFSAEARERIKAENEELDGKVIAKMISEEWKIVSEDKHKLAKYEARAAKANEGFEDRVVELMKEGKLPFSKSEQVKADARDEFGRPVYQLNIKTKRHCKVDYPKEKKPSKTKRVTKKKEVAAKVVKEVVAVADDEDLLLVEGEGEEEM